MKWAIGLLIIALILLLCGLGVTVGALNYTLDQINKGNAHGTCESTPGCHLYTDILIIIVLFISGVAFGSAGMVRAESIHSTMGKPELKSVDTTDKKSLDNIEDILKR